MISYIKSKGYKFTKNETLGNREFREIDYTITVNDDLSTLDTVAYNTAKTYELFLDNKAYSVAKIQAILGDLRDENEVITGSADIEKQERGYLITLTFVIGD